MVDDRKLDVLRAIVEDYVATEEPVGSKALVERHGLGVSPATVRNDMAALEDEGYIHQPHTSAGRVPTDKGYRLFVDKLATLKPMSVAERRAIATLLDGAVDLDDVVQQSVRLLSQLTRQVAIVQYPTLSRSTVRHIELVALTPDPGDGDRDPQHRPGRAAPRRARRGRASTPTSPSCGSRSTGPAPGCRSPPPRPRSPTCPTPYDPSRPTPPGPSWPCSPRRCPTTAATSASRSAAPPTWRATATSTPLSARSWRPWRSTSCCSSCWGSRAADAVTVRIGHEGPYSELAATSVVATGYGPHEFHLGSLGVVGPTRMDYPGSMAAVRAVARYVSRILDEGNQ